MVRFPFIYRLRIHRIPVGIVVAILKLVRFEISNVHVGILGCYHRSGVLCKRCGTIAGVAKSGRIAKRAKPFQFGKDGAGSCADKAWDVDEVLAEE
ncbi:hypothetical protein Tco_0491133 [Tanacetum coccineum]